MINVVSVRVGQKYGPEYVHTLHDMVCRHLGEEQAHWCLTDRPDEVPEGVTPIAWHCGLPGWWQKVFLFSDAMPWPEGEDVLYLDLDVAVTGRLEDLPHGIIKDWNWPCYNSSVMKWKHGEHRDIWDRFTLDVIDRPTESLKGYIPRDQVNGGDQEWISQVSAWETFPPEWFVSYQNSQGWPREGAKAIIFHGSPKPHEVTEGWVPGVWRVGGFTCPPKMDGMNVSAEFAYDNIKVNVERDLEWFSGFNKQERACVIVGGGPSMKEHVQAIKDHKRRGARIITLNNALGFLHARGLTPDAHVMLDARPENAEMVKNAPKGVRYFLASQVHPDVYDALSGHEVILWHSGMHDGEQLMELVAPWYDEGPNQRPVIFVPGGGTVGTRALNLAWLSGYKKIYLYGFDSSYDGDQHHAYPQALNDADSTMLCALNGKQYRCAPWMLRQANEFQENYLALRDQGVSIYVKGRGLIPDLWRLLNEAD